MAQAEKMLKLTVELPEPVIRLLSRLGKLTHQSPETLAAQSIAGNLPPSVDNTPSDMQTDLLEMQLLPIESLRQIAQSQVQVAQQTRHLALLSGLEQGILSPEEEQELSHLRQSADQLMVRKAYAWALLRWRGIPISSLDELPLES